MWRIYRLLMLTLLLTACTLTPDYERPELDVPKQFSATAPPGESIANMDWWQLFQDEQLQLLISTALADNKNLGISLSRIEEARLTVTAVRANQFPFLGVSGFFGRERQSRKYFRGPTRTNAFC